MNVSHAWWNVLSAFLVVVSVGCGKRGDTRKSDGPMPANERQSITGTIAFVSERGESKDVWLIRPSGEETRLTEGPEDEFPAIVVPGGASLLVIATREVDGVHLEQLRMVSVDGTATVPLHPPRERSRNPSFAPDGSFLVAESNEYGFSDLVRMAPGTQPVRLTLAPQGNFEPALSPDGRTLAFVSSRSGNPDIFVMGADGTDETARQLTRSTSEDMAPVWSPDGRMLAYLSTRDRRRRVFVMAADGTGARAVSGDASTGDEREYAWHPNGDSLVFVGRQKSGETRIWVAAIGASPGQASSARVLALTDGKSRDDQPAWSPDGRYLVFSSERAGDVDLYLMRADGTGQTRLTEARGPDWLPRWLPN